MKSWLRLLAIASTCLLGTTCGWADELETLPSDPMSKPSTSSYITLRKQVFQVSGPDGKMGKARLVLDRGSGVLSCFTNPPQSVYANAMVAVQLESSDGTYTCFGGQEPLERLARDRKVTPTWVRGPKGGRQNCAASTVMSLGRVGAGSTSPKIFENEEEWDEEEEEELEQEFWTGFDLADAADGPGGGVGGGPQCMQECNAALGAAVRLCNVTPPPTRAICLIGAGALYVACIATC